MKLSDQTMQQLMERYYAGEPVTPLIQEFNLGIAPSKLILTFPPIVHDELCPFCAVNYQTKRGSRSHSSLYSSTKYTCCPKCGHTISDTCSCHHCCELAVQKRKKEEKENELAVVEYFNSIYTPPPKIDSLVMKSSIYLLALLRTGTNEELASILPLRIQPNKLAPNDECAKIITDHLIESSLIFPSPFSSIKAFEFNEDGVTGFDIYSVHWISGHLNEGIRLQQIILELEHHIDNLLAEKNSAQELASVWREIALYEVLSYLDEIILKHSFTLRSGEKTKLVINQILEHYSIAQAFNFCWSAVRNAASFYLSHNVSKIHAVNTIPGHIQRSAERAQAENWLNKDYRRSYNNTPSVLASLFSDRVTALGDRYISQTPISCNIYQV